MVGENDKGTLLWNVTEFTLLYIYRYLLMLQPFLCKITPLIFRHLAIDSIYLVKTDKLHCNTGNHLSQRTMNLYGILNL